MANYLIYPDWPAPENIKAITTTRQGGFSSPPYDELNLGNHVGDDPDAVNKNRDYLVKLAQLPQSPRWLTQVHGTQVLKSQNWQADSEADAIISYQSNHVCTIMTADCLPILLCNQQGSTVAAIHAGWRGLAAGIIEKTIQQFSCSGSEIMAWLGPAIGPEKFEVGQDVYNYFVSQNCNADEAFKQTDQHHFLADIYLLARQRLHSVDVTAVYGGDLCTVSDPNRFFSYRRDDITGRQASMIWKTNK